MAASCEKSGCGLRVLELYSGIGGMHWALKEAAVTFQVVQAMDVNTTANKIYQHNFPDVCVNASSITKLTAGQLKKWRPDAILMSPPCQPFTRVGKKQDSEDPRTQSFLHLMQLLRSIPDRPKYILVENVKGFEVSETRKLLVEMLQDCDYAFQEFLLSPLQFGVPNARLRYYLIAKVTSLQFGFQTSDKILEEIPVEAQSWLRFRKSRRVSSMKFPSSSQHQVAVSAVSTSPPEVTQCLQPSKASPSTDADENKEKSASVLHSAVDEQSQVQVLSNCEQRTVQCEPHPSGERTAGHMLNSALREQSINSLHTNSVPVTKTVSASSTPSTHSSAQSDVVHNRRVLQSDILQASGDHCDKDISQHQDVSERNLTAMKDAGRNMRHCEEDDPLVCSDGAQLLEYLEGGRNDDYFNQFLLSDKELRMFVVMDIVHRTFRKSACFTKRYGHYVEGAGSLLQMTDDIEVVQEASEFKSRAVEQKNRQEWGEAELSILRRLRLRYFTPREVANLLCFPQEFTFPSEFSTIQCHRVLGNSLNVHVVAVLIHLMLL